jgi:hypothetical protein
MGERVERDFPRFSLLFFLHLQHLSLPTPLDSFLKVAQSSADHFLPHRFDHLPVHLPADL